MTVMRVATINGMVLTYDTDDVEDVRISTPNDVHDVVVTPSGYVRRKLGQAHLHLRVDFKRGKRPLWVKDDEDTSQEGPDAGKQAGHERPAMTDLAAQIRATLDAFAHPETDTERWIRKNPDTADGVGFPIDAYETELAAGRRAHAALFAVLDATDPAQLPPNGCGDDGCLALWVRHVIAEKLGIEADDG